MYNRNSRDYNYMERVENRRVNKFARSKQLKRQRILIYIGIFFTVLFCVIFSIRAFVYANDTKETSQNNKQYTSIMIYCNDTIESIAKEYYIKNSYSSANSFEKEIMSINHLDYNSKLVPGNYLVVPYYTN